MNKKGSMELSVNSIVILVIAIVMLGLILGFVKSKFGAMDKQLVNNEPEAPVATASNPITISRETIAVSPGEDITLKVQAYAVKNITATDIPTILCSDTNFKIAKVRVQGKQVLQGEVGTYLMTALMPPAAKGKYLCSLNMTIAQTGAGVTLSPMVYSSKDIVIEVQ